MRGIEAAGVAGHRDQPGLLLLREHRFGVGEAVGERDLDLDVLARFEALDRLVGVELGRGRQDDRVDIAAPGFRRGRW